jgi:hypothetical protein
MRSGRTTFGLSGLTADAMPEITDFLVDVATQSANDAHEASPTPSFELQAPMPAGVRPLIDDVKSYYQEAANEQPGSESPTADRMSRWFYHETRMGNLIFDIRDTLTKIHSAKTADTNGTQSPPGPPPPNIIPMRFAKRPN